MPWVRIDDGYADHPKIAAVGPLGQALWFAGLAYCNRNLTDGLIPWAVAGRLVSWTFLDATGPTTIYVGTPAVVSEEGAVTSEYVIELLLDAGLWEQAPTGYRIHDYTDYQPTKAQVLAEREQKVAAGKAGGLAAAKARAGAPAKAPAQAESKPVPVPVPVPAPPRSSVVSLPQSGDARATDEWNEPEGEALTWLARHGCHVRPGNGYHQKLVLAVEQHGVNAVIGWFDRLSRAGVLDGDVKGFVFGAIDGLNPKVDPRALERQDDERRHHEAELARTRRLIEEQERRAAS